MAHLCKRSIEENYRFHIACFWCCVAWSISIPCCKTDSIRSIGDLLAIVGVLLEPVCKIRKEEKWSNCDHGREISSSFFVTSSDTTKLLKSIDEPFNDVAFAVMWFLKGTSATFVALASDSKTNILSMKISAKGSAGVALISYYPFGTQAHLPWTSANSAGLHQCFRLTDVTFLSRREQKRDQSARAFTTKADFGAETTTTTP